MKRTAIVLSLLSIFALACASNMTNSPAPLGGSAAVTGKFSPTHYRLVSDPDMVLEIDWFKVPRGHHVKGQMTSTNIIWSSQVEGSGKLCADGKEWVSLNDGKIHAETETPVAPYILGCRAGNGLFRPASNEVYAQ